MSSTPDLYTRLRTFNARHGMFQPGGIVLAAVSGGIDSLVLLHTLRALAAEFGITLHAATLDHGIRGEAGAQDVAHVRAICAAWGVPLIVGKADVPALARQERMGLEAAARRARYRFLAECAETLRSGIVATGHHRDDQAETVLLHVIRGTGLAGLRGMPPVAGLEGIAGIPTGVRLIRPLLDAPRAAIADYAAVHHIEAAQDATNTDPAYTRNRLRHEVIPLLATINPQIGAALAHLAEIAREDYGALVGLLPPVERHTGRARFDLKSFQALPPALQRMTVRSAAECADPALTLDFARLEAAARGLAQGTLRRAVLNDTTHLRVSGAQVVVFNPAIYPPEYPHLRAGETLVIPDPGEYALPGSGWTLTVTHDPGETPDSPFSATFDLPARAQIVLRTPRPGDRYAPAGLAGRSQKLGDAFTNAKIVTAWRDRVPLLDIDDHIVWIIPPEAPARFGMGPAGDRRWGFTFRRSAYVLPAFIKR